MCFSHMEHGFVLLVQWDESVYMVLITGISKPCRWTTRRKACSTCYDERISTYLDVSGSWPQLSVWEANGMLTKYLQIIMWYTKQKMGKIPMALLTFWLQGLVKRETRFTSKSPANEIVSKIEEAALPLGFDVKKTNNKVYSKFLLHLIFVLPTSDGQLDTEWTVNLFRSFTRY